MASISKTVRPKRSSNRTVTPSGFGLAVSRGTPTAAAGSTATQLAVTTQPAGAVSGSAFTTQPVVQLRNTGGGNVSEAGITVTAYLVSGSGTLGGSVTAVTNSSGTATFANLQITGAGAHVLGFHALMSNVQTIWSDDVETDRSASYFEVNTAGGAFGRASVDGSMRWRSVQSGAGPEFGNLKLGIGRTPSGVTSVGPTGVDFGLVTMECDIYHSVNNLTNSQDKCLRMSVFSASDWSQAAVAHIWSNGTTHLEIDPVTSVVNNVPTAVGWNDFAHFTWTGLTAGTNALFGATATTLRRLKVTWRLNDPGQANGYIQQYIDGVLDAQQTGLNLMQAYTGYGINAVHWENYRTGGVSTANNRMYDNLAVSGQARALVSANSLTVSTGASAAVSGTASSGWYESEVVTGGDTIILTLTSEAFVAAGATFDAQRQNIIDGIVASTSPANGWNAVRSSIPVSAVVRTANTQVTITLPALASYSITSNQSLTVTIPATALVQGIAIVASPTLTIQNGSPSTGLGGPNEPAGMTQAFSEAWNTTPNGRTGSQNWITDGSGANFSIVTDATAPISPSNVLQVAFPAGFGAGFSPAQAYYAESGGLPTNTGTLYMRCQMKISSNWTDNGNAGTKFCFVRPHTGEGGGSGAQTNHFLTLTWFGQLDLGFSTQGPDFTDYDTGANLTKNVWHDMEFLLTLGTSGSANDGTAKVWANGTQILNASGIKMLYNGQSVGSGWKYLFLDPTYGGGTNTPPANLNFQIDHWYASVK